MPPLWLLAPTLRSSSASPQSPGVGLPRVYPPLLTAKQQLARCPHAHRAAESRWGLAVARRRTRVESSGDVMPAELLEAGSPIARREWFAARRPHGWRGQYAAIMAARAAQGIVTPEARSAMTR